MHRKNPNRKFSLRFGKEETSTEDKKPCLQGFVPSWSFLTRLRRPYLFSRKRKDRGEKSAWTRLAHPASEFRQVPMFQASFHTILTSQASDYAPPDTGGSKFATSCRRIPAINRRCRPGLLVCTFLHWILLFLHAPKAPLSGADSPYQGEMSRRDKRGRDAVTEGD